MINGKAAIMLQHFQWIFIADDAQNVQENKWFQSKHMHFDFMLVYRYKAHQNLNNVPEVILNLNL